MTDTPTTPDAADKAAEALFHYDSAFRQPSPSQIAVAAIIREHYADLQAERDEAVDRLRDLVREALRYQPGEVNAMLSGVARSNSTYLTRIDAKQPAPAKKSRSVNDLIPDHLKSLQQNAAEMGFRDEQEGGGE